MLLGWSNGEGWQKMECGSSFLTKTWQRVFLQDMDVDGRVISDNFKEDGCSMSHLNQDTSGRLLCSR